MEGNLIDSDFTSIQQRLFDYAKHKPQKNADEKRLMKRVQEQRQLKEDLKLDRQSESDLMVFSGSSHVGIDDALPFTCEDYFDLVDSTGKIVWEDRRGFIKENAPPILQQFGINPDLWLEHVRFFGKQYSFCVGRESKMRNFVEILNRGLGKGLSASRRLYC